MTPGATGSIAVLIPCYLEKLHIREVAGSAAKFLPKVLVVDDGSEDGTAEEARAAGVEVLVHPLNRGKGAAIKSGLRQLLEEGVEYVLVLDGDGQHRTDEIPRFVAAADGAVQLVLGNRMASTKDMPIHRRWTNQFMSAVVSRRCGQCIPDSQCGFRMLHRDLAAVLLEKAHTAAYEFETEMLLLAARMGHRIVSVPVSTVYGDETSKIRPVRDAIAFFRLLSRFK